MDVPVGKCGYLTERETSVLDVPDDGDSDSEKERPS